MTYQIGVGLLLDDAHFNKVRDIEVSIAEETGNDNGLRQPPHITVKRPFQIADHRQLQKAVEIVSKVAKNTRKITVQFNGVAHFGTRVLYIKAETHTGLTQLHASLVEEFAKHYDRCIDRFELDNMVFHTTVASGLAEAEFRAAMQFGDNLNETNCTFASKADKLGLFLSADGGQNWIIYAVASLK